MNGREVVVGRGDGAALADSERGEGEDDDSLDSSFVWDIVLSWLALGRVTP
jgi:hypothetical protein